MYIAYIKKYKIQYSIFCLVYFSVQYNTTSNKDNVQTFY